MQRKELNKMTYYQLERAALKYLPNNINEELEHELSINVSNYDEFFKFKCTEETQELYAFTTMLLFQKAQNNFLKVSDYIKERYNTSVENLIFNAMADELFKEGE